MYSHLLYIRGRDLNSYLSLDGEGRERFRLPYALPIIPSLRGRGKAESFTI